MSNRSWLLAAASFTLCLAGVALQSENAQARDPQMAKDTSGSASQRAKQMVAQMTQDEKLALVSGQYSDDFPTYGYRAPYEARSGSAGYVPGVPRLGIPPQWQTDGGMGVATQSGALHKRPRTALPSAMAVAATWDIGMAFEAGKMIGAEARADGFNVMLAGGANLLREPRNGRSFEYASEDPLLTGAIVGAKVAGIQSNDIISTVKHFAVNDHETDRFTSNSVLDEADLRMSDLLAFQIAIERGNPGAVMCAHNKVNGEHSCENEFLLTRILRKEWGWQGYVMATSGAARSTEKSASAGLDQDSGVGRQVQAYYEGKLREALNNGKVSRSKLDQMVTNILTAMFEHGVIDNPVSPGPTSFAAHREVSLKTAEAGAVLLKNSGNLLPLDPTVTRIAVIGGHADKGVLSGGGSSQVYPDGGNAVPGIETGQAVYYPSAPLDELRKALPDAQIDFADGSDPGAAAALAARAEIAIIFATQWRTEGADTTLTLPDGQDVLIKTIAEANPKTVVVLETGGPVLMPWVGDVKAILQAWYPGRMGGTAIANLLTGAVNPSGHLPVTFPTGMGQMPWSGAPRSGDVIYDEGAAIGYKWMDRQNHVPQFPFGFGLSYTKFAYDDFQVSLDGEKEVHAAVKVTNTGRRAGTDVVQLYAAAPNWEAPRRLVGFGRVELEPGETKLVEMDVDPRLLAMWITNQRGWVRPNGNVSFSVGHSSRELIVSDLLEMPYRYVWSDWRPVSD